MALSKRETLLHLSPSLSLGGRVDDDEMFEEALVDKKGVRWGGICRGQKGKEWVEGPLHILQYNPNKGEALLFIFHETLF